MSGTEASARYVDMTSWSDAASRETLDLIAASALELVDFRVACISIVLDDLLVAVSVAGDPAAREQLLGSAYPLERLRRELDRAQVWGRFRFLPEERYDVRTTDAMWVPDLVPLGGDDAWRPLDLLAAPLLDADGEWIGVMSIDLPISGRRPGADQRRLLERYAAQAERAVQLAMDRAEIAEQIRLADTARALVRVSTGDASARQVLREVRGALLEGYRAHALWMLVDDGAGSTFSVRAGRPGPVLSLEHPALRILDTLTRRLWEEQTVAVVGPEAPTATPLVEPADLELVVQEMAVRGQGTMLVAPLGAGEAYFGMLALTRRPGGRPWSAVESAGALDIGRDLGSAILDARAFERERRLAQELRELDTYKSRLIATVSHEIKTPLMAIASHLEMLDLADDPLPDPTRASLGAMDRGTRRLGRVVDDLLTLARLADPVGRGEQAGPVDLVGVVAEVLDEMAPRAENHGVALHVDARSGATDVPGTPRDLRQVVAQLLDNAIGYSRPGGKVSVTVEHPGSHVELTVADRGIGIEEHELPEVFTEFWRSPHPRVRAAVGTGLGLTIVQRVAERWGGEVAISSRPGMGTTVVVRLPAA